MQSSSIASGSFALAPSVLAISCGSAVAADDGILGDRVASVT